MKVKLIKVSKNKLELIKLVRWFTDLGLKECKNIVDNPPSVFEIKNKNLSFEQINKNFSSIGAIIEIEKKIINEPDISVGGAGSVVDMPELNEPDIIIEDKRINKPDDYLNSLNEKADRYALARGIKSSITISIIAALIIPFITSFFSFYYTFYIVLFIVSVANAIVLKKETYTENDNIAKIASSMTFFFYIVSYLFHSIYFSFLYKIPLRFGAFFNVLSIDFFAIIIAMGISYFLVAKKNPLDAIAKAKLFNKKDNDYTSKKKNDYSKKRKSIKKKKKKY